MIGGILLLLITTVVGLSIIQRFANKFPRLDVDIMRAILAMHVFQTIVYYLYATFNPSDSHFYYEKVIIDFRGPDWSSFYGTSTTFIEWVGYPFIKYMGFSYEAMMVLFSFLGFLGFLYFYVFYKENIRFKHRFMGFDLITLIFLLPNIHFWSASFGKGSIILLGIGMFFYAITKPQKRLFELIFAASIIYHVRPHIMFVLLASSLIGFTFSSKGLSVSLRIGMIMLGLVGFAVIYQDVLAIVGIQEGQELGQGLDLTHRATELTKATSGVDITGYSLPVQVFTFVYRPLFFDAPGLLGIIVSFENVFYLLFTLQLFTPRGLKSLLTGNFIIKTAFFSFLTVSIALAQIAGNLGIAMRQKSQVMLLLLFVVVAMLDQRKLKDYKAFKLRRRRKQQAAQARAQSANEALAHQDH